MRILPTEEEAKIFNMLLDAARHCNLKTEMRVAGGWVRDKLLGLQSEDLDIALDNMTGQQFCRAISPYLRQIGAAYNFKVIQSNPDRSKHLETTKLTVMNQTIDFVNLRSETYSEHSRVPIMKFGTPSEDAYRRDLTINSLFYNISTEKLEDFTGQGVSDLKSGVIRTPLPPLVTFLDDPLRVLRSVRFAARFDFELDLELESMASNESVKHALCRKVSEERVADEVKRMIFGNSPVKALGLLHRIGYFGLVFKQLHALESSCMESFEAVHEMLQLFSALEEAERRIILIAGLLISFKGANMTLVTVLESLNLKSMLGDIKQLYEAAGNTCLREWYEVNKTRLLSGLSASFEGELRVGTGLVLKDMRYTTAFALVYTLLVAPASNRPQVSKAVANSISQSGFIKMKPLLTGNDLQMELKIRPGPQLGKLVGDLLVWQLQNPSATQADCREWLRLQPVPTEPPVWKKVRSDLKRKEVCTL